MTTKAKAEKAVDDPVAPEQVGPEQVAPEGMWEGLPEATVKTNLPEAGGIAWVELWGIKRDAENNAHDVKINLTARGFTAIDALEGLLDAMTVASENYKLHPYRVGEKPPANTGHVAEASGPAVAPNGPPAPAGGKTEPVYEDVETNGSFIATSLVVTPRDDGKAKLDFMAAGHQYPDVSAVMTPEQLAQMLSVVAAWKPEHFKVARRYDINYRVQWRNSDRLNRNNKPYKNIVGISLP